VSVDIAAAKAFMTTHARLLDRRRLLRIIGDPDPGDVVAALDAYRNADGGYGWGAEPDLRSTESQPGGALHAFEVFEEMAPATAPQAAELCEWLASVTLEDGGLPFALPVREPAGSASFWVDADASASSLHITAAVVGIAQRVSRQDPAVAGHPWLATATQYCVDSIARMEQPEHALELRYALQFLDAVVDDQPNARAQLDRLGEFIPASGLLHVVGGLDDEMMRPLDFAPIPDRPVRGLFAHDVVAADLDRLAGLQSADGGWPSAWASSSPAAELEWRGWLTVRAVAILEPNAMLDEDSSA
jgi:hypothetical protein